jgi:hypothetical protein
VKNKALFFGVVASLVGSLTFVAPAMGQQSDFWRDFSDWEARRDALNRAAEAHARSGPSRRPVKTLRHGQDLNRIKALNLEIEQAVSQGHALDFNFLAKSAAEINKRGKRLQVSLAFQSAKERDRKTLEAKPDEVAALLKALGSSITSFTNNPVFRNPRLVDVKQLAKARGDLEAVIELSDWVEQSCKKLARSTGN